MKSMLIVLFLTVAQLGMAQNEIPLIERKGNLVQNKYYILGKVVYSEKLSSALGVQEIRWDATEVQKGIYICKIELPGGIKTVKLTVN
jgi:FAD synthase